MRNDTTHAARSRYCRSKIDLLGIVIMHNNMLQTKGMKLGNNSNTKQQLASPSETLAQLKKVNDAGIFLECIEKRVGCSGTAVEIEKYLKTVPVDICDKEGRTALILASRSRIKISKRNKESLAETKAAQTKAIQTKAFILDAVMVLLDNGASVNQQDNMGRSPLIAASMTDKKELVSLLLERKADTNLRTERGETALLLSVRTGLVDIVDVLLTDPNINLDLKNEDGWSALMYASRGGNLALVRALLDKGANINLQSSDGETALMIAAHYGDLGTTSLLLDRGADIRLADKTGSTALSTATKWGRSAVISALLSKDSSAEHIEHQTQFGETALTIAVRRNLSENVISLLLDKRADIESMTSLDGNTPLIWAAYNGNVLTTELLVSRGASVNQMTKSGNTALVTAARWNKVKTAALLLEKHAEVGHQTNDGWTALMWAARWNHVAMVRLLLEHKADPLKQTLQEGYSALTLASRYGHKKTAALLLSSVDPDARKLLVNLASHTDDKTPLDYASDNGWGEVIDLLVSHGGVRNKGRPEPEMKSEFHKTDLSKTSGPFLSEKSRKLMLKQTRNLIKTI